MSFYKSAIRPLLFGLDPELAHNLTFRAGKLGTSLPFSESLLSSIFKPNSSTRLSSNHFGLNFANPIGLAAGFDKNAELVPLIKNLGFGFMEVGSICNKASKGNPKPRLWRLPEDEAVINRMGLNGHGADIILPRLPEKIETFPIGINFSKTNSSELTGDLALRDFLSCYNKGKNYGDFHILNISCPNTASGKTFEEPTSLKDLLKEVSKERTSIPLLVKASPDLEAESFENLLEIILENKIDGLVLGNTSLKREGLKTPKDKIDKIGKGGLSGPPLRMASLEKVKRAFKRTSGELPVIGLGGINSLETALSYFKAGARLIEAYTSLVYEGPGFAYRLNRDLDLYLKKEGIKNLSELIGMDA